MKTLITTVIKNNMSADFEDVSSLLHRFVPFSHLLHPSHPLDQEFGDAAASLLSRFHQTLILDKTQDLL